MTLASRSALALALILPTFGCAGDSGNTDATTDTATTKPTDGSTSGASATGTGVTDTSTSEPTTGSGSAYCRHQCSADADCRVNGHDIGLICHESTCTGDSCTTKDECVAEYSDWTIPCTADGGECDETAQVCVQAGGGLCATPAIDFETCSFVDMVDIEVPDINGVPVTVCAEPAAECASEGYCFLPCKADTDCTSALCNVGTGMCDCGDDSYCASLGLPHHSVCNAGSCGCGSDQQCVDGQAGDLCTSSGRCGCSSDAACAGMPNEYDGGMIACVGE